MTQDGAKASGYRQCQCSALRDGEIANGHGEGGKEKEMLERRVGKRKVKVRTVTVAVGNASPVVLSSAWKTKCKFPGMWSKTSVR